MEKINYDLNMNLFMAKILEFNAKKKQKLILTKNFHSKIILYLIFEK